MTAQEVLHAGVQEEAQKNLARVAQHHDERHQRPPRSADLEVAKVGPVHLCLFSRQAAQTQIGFGFRSGSMAGDQVAKMVGAAAIAALAHHRVKPTGRQRRERLQRLADERQIGVDLRRARRRSRLGQPGLRQHPPHGAVVNMQLPGDRAHPPFLSVVVA
jgi:hypothetical protein